MFAASTAPALCLVCIPLQSAPRSCSRLLTSLPRWAVRPGVQGCLAPVYAQGLAMSSHKWALKCPLLKHMPGMEFLSLSAADILGGIILSHWGGVLCCTLQDT